MSKEMRKMIDKVNKINQSVNEKLILGSKERTNLSTKPIEELKNVNPEGSELGKPLGLWYGFGSNWINFIKDGVTWDADYGTTLKSVIGDEIYIYKIYLDLSNIIILNTNDKVYDFCEEYSFGDKIDWTKVSKKYKGIEIPNFESLGVRSWWKDKRDNKYEWLYTWDVNSGCIWDVSAITKYRKL